MEMALYKQNITTIAFVKQVSLKLNVKDKGEVHDKSYGVYMGKNS